MMDPNILDQSTARQKHHAVDTIDNSIRPCNDADANWISFYSVTDRPQNCADASSRGDRVIEAKLVPQGLCRVTEAAKYLSMSRAKLYQLINDGEIPSKRFGKSVRVPWTWLLAQAEVASDGTEVAR